MRLNDTQPEPVNPDDDRLRRMAELNDKLETIRFRHNVAKIAAALPVIVPTINRLAIALEARA